MTRGKQKIEAQRKNAEKNQKGKGSQLEARAVGLKVICPICKASVPYRITGFKSHKQIAQIANQNQLVDHYGSKHPKEKAPSNSE
ncbi:hypothetical protein MTR67_036456 [Solanum verrucosum]|uniref:Small EDRK-rich factor-like N-terminal domain-containing protein n=1 Tax=Solanum verrucosum TaxID=315347 RepID=A0AAF0UCB0_SOLVR|nr:hypothetical protein MTR67_036456 [Solanum verrucosum]